MKHYDKETSMTWYRNWFDSKYYHVLYKNRNEEEARYFINNLIQCLDLKKNSKLIDIACGKGRHANYFHQKGMEVVGVDLSQNNINQANIFTKSLLKFHVHDMRKVFKKNYFDIVTNLFTSFGYFEHKSDNLVTLNSMSKNLKKNGLLIIDFMNSEKVIKNLIKKEVKNIDNITFKIKRYNLKNHIVKEINIHDKNDKLQFKEKVQSLNLSDFQKLITKTELKIINIFGDYSLNKFDKKSSDRLILILKK